MRLRWWWWMDGGWHRRERVCRINNKLPIKSDLLELQLKALVAESPNPTYTKPGWWSLVLRSDMDGRPDFCRWHGDVAFRHELVIIRQSLWCWDRLFLSDYTLPHHPVLIICPRANWTGWAQVVDWMVCRSCRRQRFEWKWVYTFDFDCRAKKFDWMVFDKERQEDEDDGDYDDGGLCDLS